MVRGWQYLVESLSCRELSEMVAGVGNMSSRLERWFEVGSVSSRASRRRTAVSQVCFVFAHNLIVRSSGATRVHDYWPRGKVFIYRLIDLLTYQVLFYSFIHFFLSIHFYSSIHLFIYSFIHLCIYSFIYLNIHLLIFNF